MNEVNQTPEAQPKRSLLHRFVRPVLAILAVCGLWLYIAIVICVFAIICLIFLGIAHGVGVSLLWLFPSMGKPEEALGIGLCFIPAIGMLIALSIGAFREAMKTNV